MGINASEDVDGNVNVDVHKSILRPWFIRIKESPIAGYGIYTTRAFTEGTKILVARWVINTPEIVVEDGMVVDEKESDIIMPSVAGALGNQPKAGDEPNCKTQAAEDWVLPYGNGQICPIDLVAIKDIGIGDELTWMYTLYDPTVEAKRFDVV